VIRRTRLDLVELYEREGPYWYKNGWNPVAVIALVGGVLPNLPGFLGTIKVMSVSAFWTEFYHYAWFSGFAVSFFLYIALTLALRPGKTAAA
jgi:nucleobase:cation symporter-1, NCS1 family